MRLSTLLFLALCALFIILPYVAAGPGGFVTLINATPYEWKLTYSHAYHMDWKPATVIPAGASHQQYLEWWYDHGEKGDCAAEATYELVGSPEKASFQLQARQTNGKKIRVQYLDSLTSLNNKRHSLLDLGFEHDGSVLFVLAGDGEEEYVSSNPPAGWMQATLPTIGSKPLREISLPASHNAGMSKLDRGYLFGGINHNTAAQTLNMKEQLMSGARWFDIRPVHVNRHGWIVKYPVVEWHTGHFSTAIWGEVVGGAGQSMAEIIDSVNEFTQSHPGELIILDLNHELDSGKLYFQWTWSFTPQRWQYLYELLGGIKDLWDTNSTVPADYSAVPLSTFIQPGSKSAVLIRIPGHAPMPLADVQTKFHSDHLPLSAFVRASDLHFRGSYSNTDDPKHLANDQLEKLQDQRPSPQSQIQRSTWTITPGIWKVIDFANPKSSIVGLAHLAHRQLFKHLWPNLSKITYPNLIEVDAFNNQITALCMAINNKFARQ